MAAVDDLSPDAFAAAFDRQIDAYAAWLEFMAAEPNLDQLSDVTREGIASVQLVIGIVKELSATPPTDDATDRIKDRWIELIYQYARSLEIALECAALAYFQETGRRAPGLARDRAERDGRIVRFVEEFPDTYEYLSAADQASLRQRGYKHAKSKLPPIRSRGRVRQSHRTRPGHRRAVSTRAGPAGDPDPPDGPAEGLRRHPRYGRVNAAMAAWLEAHS
jgi:hypothetical protein